jgi:hypothetical protein
MRPATRHSRRSAVPLALAAVASGAVAPASTSADPAQAGCRIPAVVGVSLGMARHAIGASGCHVVIHQLPAHGRFVTPESADDRQLVARQSPGPGGRASVVTVTLRPLCSQPSEPGPEGTGPTSRPGPTELVAGLFRQGGPPRLTPSCRTGSPAAGVLTISSPSGQVIAHRTVKRGNFGVFPLKPGPYLITGTLGDTASGAAIQLGPEPVRIAAHRTTRINVVEAVR